jgi:cytochrome c oxidase subunit 3
LGVIAAVIVWFFLQQRLTAKPWLEEGPIVDHYDGGALSLPAAKLGLRVFFAVVSVLFMLLIIAYGSRMQFEDWRPAPQLSLLWVNTAILVSSSAAMQWALIAARRGETDSLMIGLFAGGVLAVAFLGGQTLAWRQLHMLGAFDVTHPAIGFFYLITALHGLHLLGGLVAWGRTTAKVWSGVDLDHVRLSVELCTIYWHFLLVVWLVLFGLLFSGNDNLGILLAICGIR